MNPSITESVPLVCDKGDEKKGPYRVGTLSYTLPGLLIMMLWLLWGDFCFSLMEAVFPAVAPLMLGELEAPNWMIAVFLSTIPGVLNATVCPFVSYWSDRYRSPLGRRIPFILYTVPFLCLFLILIGLAPFLGKWTAAAGWIGDARIATLSLMGLFIAGFQFFNMFVASVYYYLFNDVVPAQFLGRFLATFRVVGMLANSLFYLFVFPIAETHYVHIFVGAALLYGVVFYLMCRHVKEGGYPTPPATEGELTVIGGIRTFFKESFSQRFYWWFYLSVAFWSAAAASGIFGIFFSRSIGLSLTQIGTFSGIGGVISAALLIPCGFLSDKIHPIRTLLIATLLMAGCSALGLVFLLFSIRQEITFIVWCIISGASIPVAALFTASELPAYMKVLPKQRFGQFASANAMLRSVFTVVAGLGCGVLMDLLKTVDPDRAYLYLPICPTMFQFISAFCLWRLYLKWKQLGGDESFTPPQRYPG